MDLSLQLQSLLGQHAVLAADMMRARLRGDQDFAQVANASLGKNTDAMGQLVGSMFGAQARESFAPLWSAHVTALFNYARGLADKDNAVRNQARAQSEQYEKQLADFFAGASQGRLPNQTARSAVQTHVKHLLDGADAYAAGDYRRADGIYRDSYTHTFGLGRALAGALLPPATAASLNAPTWQLRSELGRLLGEHVALVVAAMRAGVTNDDHFTAAAETVNANTRDLAGAVDSLFGAPAAQKFQSLWADHVDLFMAYTAAAVKKDDDARRDILAKFTSFEQQLASFLDTATGKRLESEALAKAFLEHDQMLVRQADAFAAKEYQEAHDLAYSTYQQMFDLARQLSDAFGATIAARLPRGAAETGHGGMVAGVKDR